MNSQPTLRAPAAATQAHGPGSAIERSLDSNVTTYSKQIEFIDLYTVNRLPNTPPDPHTCESFHAPITLLPPATSPFPTRCTIDDGACASIMDLQFWQTNSAALGPLQPSKRNFRMGNGSAQAAHGAWLGRVTLGGQTCEVRFDVFPSGGDWKILVGKPLLRALSAVHVYADNCLRIPCGDSFTTLRNEHPNARRPLPAVSALPPADTGEKLGNVVGDNLSSPSRQVQSHIPTPSREQNDQQNLQNPRYPAPAVYRPPPLRQPHYPSPPSLEPRSTGLPARTNAENRSGGSLSPPARRVPDPVPVQALEQNDQSFVAEQFPEPIVDFRGPFSKRPKGQARRDIGGKKSPPSRQVQPHDLLHSPERNDKQPEYPDADDPHAGQVPDLAETPSETVFTRKTDPFNPERVRRILNAVTVGDDLSAEERREVYALIEEFADIFALSLSEVSTVDFEEHRLDVPTNAVFSTSVHQRPLTLAQKEFYFPLIDEMLKADIIRRIDPEDLKAVSPTTLAPKAHALDRNDLSVEQMRARVNYECVQSGLFDPSELGPDAELLPPPPPIEPGTAPKAKWRVCHNFKEVNDATQVPAFPQGDIQAKLQRLAGHRYVCTFDFAAGFYAIPVAEESQPYTAFFVPGRGYFCYRRMPFGLTGAPTRFGSMCAKALDGLIDTEMELFVDDGGLAGDEFASTMPRLRTVFTRIREKKLSVSPSKCLFFMSEATFAGGRVSQAGVKADHQKLSALVNWPRPENGAALAQFIGLGNFFRTLVKDYAKITRPLANLNAEGLKTLPPKASKNIWQKGMRSFNVAARWKPEHERSFLNLKRILTTEPTLRSPQFDGTPFILCTDGSALGFGAVLSQRFKDMDKNGITTTRTCPVAFASKRTSSAEANYQPFLLEFAALKFALDTFSDIIWAYPIEVETDCQALKDTMLSSKLSSIHTRWRNGVCAYHIVDIRHRPGESNGAADGFSRMFEFMPVLPGDGHEWTVSPDWEARTGLAHDLFSVESLPAEHANLRERFKNEPLFLEVIDALLNLDYDKSVSSKARARHRATGYFLSYGKLWKIPTPTKSRVRERVECITQEEAGAIAEDIHRNHAHFGRDLIKLQMMDKYFCPRMDQIITSKILECPECKNFGGMHLHALLEPITRRHPFELVVADYLSMPAGKGGYSEILVLVDTFSQYTWALKLKQKGRAVDTVRALMTIARTFVPPETFMTDGGTHFNNSAVRTSCEEMGTKHHVVPAYSPWVNGLVENTNKLLVGRLKRACAPALGEDDELTEARGMRNWPDHLDAALADLNARILPAFGYAPRELALGLVVNTTHTDETTGQEEPSPLQVETQLAYVAQQQADAYSNIVDHAARRKAKFDARVNRQTGEVIFENGSLVQVYSNVHDFSVASERKMAPRWSAPRRIASRTVNSYQLETLEGFPIAGHFHARRLRQFVPRATTELHRIQAQFLTHGRQLGLEEVEEEDMVDVRRIVEASGSAAVFGGGHGAGGQGSGTRTDESRRTGHASISGSDA